MSVFPLVAIASAFTAKTSVEVRLGEEFTVYLYLNCFQRTKMSDELLGRVNALQQPFEELIEETLLHG